MKNIGLVIIWTIFVRYKPYSEYSLNKTLPKIKSFTQFVQDLFKTQKCNHLSIKSKLTF